MTDQRRSIRSNAKYLRNVRPIDPEEIAEYVEGGPHPAVVRQVLREEALDLSLIERDDSTFVPAGDEPVAPRREPVRRFPPRYERRIEDLLTERYGVDWHEGVSGDLLRSTIRRFKAQYLEGSAVEYTDDVAAGYAIYHLPAYYAAVQYALEDLAERGLLERQLRVLDIGAGVGGPALGLLDSLPDRALVDYHAVEPSAGADVLEELLDEAGRNVHTTIHRTTVEAFDPSEIDGIERANGDGTEAEDRGKPGGFDLILACNVLSELDDPESVLRSALERLAPDGSLLAIAPADRNTSIQLRELERSVEGAQTDAGPEPVTIYSPAVRLWPDETPADRGWSFDVRPDLEVPSFQRRLEDAASDDEHAAGEFVNVDVQFSYTILRVDGARRIDLELDEGAWAKMAEMDRHVTNRVDLVAAKFSQSLSGKRGSARDNTSRSSVDPNPLFKISDGSEAVDHYAVCTRETSLNRPLLEADYGDILSFERALVLWNDDEGAYNLVVDGETVVDRIA